MRHDATDGFPTDYLIARIRGRGTALITDWRRLIEHGPLPEASDERIWEALLRELAWLHAQMNRELRDTFAPLFALFEIKTIMLCLRNRAIGRAGEIARLLERSLLADDVKAFLLRGPDVRFTIAALGLPQNEDLPAFENGLMRLFLEDVAVRRLEPALKTFFTEFIDLRNVMLLYKHLRWSLAGRCRFISGGSVELPLLEEIARQRDDAAFDALLERVTGLATVSVAASEGALETILLRSITKRLLKSRHAAGNLALIVAYVWRLYVQARNLAVLHHGTRIEQRTLERELIL